MIQKLLIFAAVTAVASCEFTSGLRVTFGSSTNTSDIGSKFFFDLPRNVSAAVSAGWTLTTRPSGSPLSSLTLYCYENRTVCTLYEPDTGIVAGLQVAVDTSAFTDAVIDWEIQGWTSWTPSNDGKTYWATQQYFVDEEYMAKSADERESSRNTSRTLQMDGVWVTFNNQLIKMSNTASALEATSFYKQGCIARMGVHYYINMTTSLSCSAELMVPWFALLESDEMIGSGITLFGKQTVNPVREWLERQVRAGVALAIPDAPTCLLDLVDSPGLISMHIYYVDNPEDIACS